MSPCLSAPVLFPARLHFSDVCESDAVCYWQSGWQKQTKYDPICNKGILTSSSLPFVFHLTAPPPKHLSLTLPSFLSHKPSAPCSPPSSWGRCSLPPTSPTSLSPPSSSSSSSSLYLSSEVCLIALQTGWSTLPEVMSWEWHLLPPHSWLGVCVCVCVSVYVCVCVCEILRKKTNKQWCHFCVYCCCCTDRQKGVLWCLTFSFSSVFIVTVTLCLCQTCYLRANIIRQKCV